jgi:hypothetical protein
MQYVSTTAATWISWTSNSATTTTISAANYNAWQAWTAVPTYTLTYSSTTSATWSSWNGNTYQLNQPAYVAPVETEEQRAARVIGETASREQWARENEIRKEVRRVAISKADQLLESVLNSVQREQLRKDNAFLVRSQSGAVYRIRKGRSGNVDLIDPKSGEVLSVLCAHPSMDVPDGDTVVAQKLMLECDEQDFLRLANKSSARGPRVSLDAVNRLLEAVS